MISLLVVGGLVVLAILVLVLSEPEEWWSRGTHQGRHRRDDR